MTEPFIIFALPRSRTKWLSEWLSYGGRKVGHDIAIECATPEEFLDRLSGLDGTVETGAMLAWRLLRERLPNSRFVTVRRPVEEVRKSFHQHAVIPNTGELEERDAMLTELQGSKWGDCWGVSFKGLEREVIRRWMFNHLIGRPLDAAWEKRFDRNTQIDLPARMAYLAANQDRIQNLKRLVREQEEALCLAST